MLSEYAAAYGRHPEGIVPPGSTPDQYEYYVHYEGYDRRNDEWR